MEQPNIEELITTADKRAVYLNQVEHAKAKFHSLNILAWDGHIFELHQNFIAYVHIKYMECISNREKKMAGKSIDIPFDPVIFLDKNDEPVMITDLGEFYEEMVERNSEALNYYYDIYSQLQRAQTAAELIEVY